MDQTPQSSLGYTYRGGGFASIVEREVYHLCTRTPYGTNLLTDENGKKLKKKKKKLK